MATHAHAAVRAVRRTLLVGGKPLTGNQVDDQGSRARGGLFGSNGAVAWLALTILGSAAVMWASLAGVDGVVRQGPGPDGCCRTEFVNGGWWMSGFLLPIPAFFAARGWPVLALPAAAVPAIAMFAVAQISVERYVAGGWSDGLESLSYVTAALMGMLTVAAATGGAAVGRAGARALRDDQARRAG